MLDVAVSSIHDLYLTRPPRNRKRVSGPDLICDFRSGCALIADTFPDRAALAQAAITSTPHLAEALFRAGLIADGKAAIAMALAMQEARMCPLSVCCCTTVDDGLVRQLAR